MKKNLLYKKCYKKSISVIGGVLLFLDPLKRDVSHVTKTKIMLPLLTLLDDLFMHFTFAVIILVCRTALE